MIVGSVKGAVTTLISVGLLGDQINMFVCGCVGGCVCLCLCVCVRVCVFGWVGVCGGGGVGGVGVYN